MPPIHKGAKKKGSHPAKVASKVGASSANGQEPESSTAASPTGATHVVSPTNAGPSPQGRPETEEDENALAGEGTTSPSARIQGSAYAGDDIWRWEGLGVDSIRTMGETLALTEVCVVLGYHFVLNLWLSPSSRSLLFLLPLFAPTDHAYKGHFDTMFCFQAPGSLEVLGITPESVPALLHIVLDRSTDGAPTESWAPIHALQLLQHLACLDDVDVAQVQGHKRLHGLQSSDAMFANMSGYWMAQVAALVVSEDQWLAGGAMQVLVAHPNTGLQVRCPALSAIGHDRVFNPFSKALSVCQCVICCTSRWHDMRRLRLHPLFQGTQCVICCMSHASPHHIPS